MTRIGAPAILIVEDDPNLTYGLRNNLEFEGYVVDSVSDGRDAASRVAERRYDLIVLDLMLPGMSGLDVLASMRERNDLTPVLILSAKGERDDVLQGLHLGADDYVCKPFDLQVLLARIAALLRRSWPTPKRDGRPWHVSTRETGSSGSVTRYFQFSDVVVDVDARRASRGGEAVEMSRLEFDLLVTFLLNAGRVLSRATLLEKVWHHRVVLKTRTVDYHISELRRKIGDDPTHPRHIITIRKIGYRFDP